MRKSPDIKISELDLDQIFSDDHEIAGSRIPWFRNQVIQAGGPTEDVDEILLKDHEMIEYRTITCRRGQMIPAVLLCPKLWHWGGTWESSRYMHRNKVFLKSTSKLR